VNIDELWEIGTLKEALEFFEEQRPPAQAVFDANRMSDERRDKYREKLRERPSKTHKEHMVPEGR